MVNDNTCTYLKTPAGIFTEMELPINEIWRGHEQSIIASAKLSLTRINNVLESPFSLSIPQTLLMLPKAQLQSFFEKRQIVDYQSSFLASYSSLTNSYTFSNISGLVNYMNEHRSEPDWNKVVIIPVTVGYLSTTGSISSVVHDMSLASTKLVGGSANTHAPIKLSVIYSKFK